jgi:cation diffusion facilitator CzcD-associated flavoprotein CzcO
VNKGATCLFAAKSKEALHQIYERASGIGGTWRDNTYPGCACDIPGHWYSLSSELNPEWTHYFPDQPEILEYWQELTVKHELYPRIVFDTSVLSLTWDGDAQAWNVEIETANPQDGTRKRETVSAQLVVSAAGGLVNPGYSNLEGMTVFQGPMFHSSRWQHGVDLRGKRVGVIGNGCSA